MENAFRTNSPDDLRLIETMLWEPGVGVRLWQRHRDRMCASARKLGFDFSVPTFDDVLSGVAASENQRLRLTLDRSGAFELRTAEMPAAKPGWRIAIAPEPIDRNDAWRGVKSTERALYDDTRARLPEGVDEAVFLNNAGRLVEGTITNLIFETPEGQKITPPLSDGALPGVMRAELLDQGWCRVGPVSQDMFRSARNIWLCNALRGVLSVTERLSWPE